MIKNILAFVFSAVLIDFDQKYINNSLYADYGSLIPGCTINYNVNNVQDLWKIMLSLAKGQLAGSVIMLVTALIFIGIYVYVYIRSITDDRRDWNSNVPMPPAPIPVARPPPFHSQPPTHATGPNLLNPTIVCQNCGAIVFTNDRF